MLTPAQRDVAVALCDGILETNAKLDADMHSLADALQQLRDDLGASIERLRNCPNACLEGRS